MRKIKIGMSTIEISMSTTKKRLRKIEIGMSTIEKRLRKIEIDVSKTKIGII